MIEPTDEMIAAHEQARRAYWKALDHTADGVSVREHGRRATGAGLAAVLAILGRDYLVLCNALAVHFFGEVRCDAKAGHEGKHRNIDGDSVVFW